MRELAVITEQSPTLAQVATEPLPVNTPSYLPRPQRRPRRSRLYAVTTSQPSEVDVLPEPVETGNKLVETGNKLVEAGNKLVRQVFYPSVKPNRAAAGPAFHQLTTEEFIQVRMATVRESTRHCFWPIDVLEKFLAADVITDSKGQ